jgi:signal transduction histidine kinase
MRTSLRATQIELVARAVPSSLAVLAVGTGLWLASLYSYLLFHSITEIFSIVITAGVFMISWNSRKHPEARPFVLLGIGYLFVAILDLFHTLSFEGMNVLHEVSDYPTKLWVAARAFQALATLCFAILMRLKKTAPPAAVFTVSAGVTALILLSIFMWNTFPLCFVEGQGVTPFKKASEFAISGILGVAMILVAGEREAVSRRVRNLLVAAFGLNIASELVFTLYTSAYGTENLIGHYMKIASFILTYQALIATEVRKRIAMIEELERAKAALERSETELRKAGLSKDKFFSILAHDLKNPIGGLLTLSELLARHFDQLEQRRIRELCQLIHEGTRQAMELLESILQWARAHTGRMEYCPRMVGLAALCRQVAEHLSIASQSKDVSVSVRIEESYIVYADENMLSTITRNLLSNAIKFTPRGGRVSLSAVDCADWVELSVSDTGMGMSREELEKLFLIDVHFSNKGTDQEHGNGLGLIICKELVELNHGTISVQSAPFKGSVFTVRLPRSSSPNQASPQLPFATTVLDGGGRHA